MANFQLLKVGSCFHPEAIVHPGSSWRKKEFPAIIGLLKLQNDDYMLFDTGYSSHFTRATQSFPNRLYRWLTPMHLEDNEKLPAQLTERGITVSKISHIFISHFHGDHIAGLHHFPEAKLICSRLAVTDFLKRTGVRGLLKGYLADLLPGDFLSRIICIEDLVPVPLSTALFPFKSGYDLFGNMDYVAINLHGHGFGQFGLLCHDGDEKHFLVADACWSKVAYQQLLYPSFVTNLIIADQKGYRQTMQKIHALASQNNQVNIYPSHCQVSYRRWQEIHTGA